MKLNLGCGLDYRPGWKNVDISTEVQADEHYDITEGIREADSSVDEIFAGCVLEQICSKEKFIFVLNECWRVLKPGGVLKGYVPSTDPNVLYQDPMDCRFFKLDTFNYFNVTHRYYQRFGKNYGFEPWKILKCEMLNNGVIEFAMMPAKKV